MARSNEHTYSQSLAKRLVSLVITVALIAVGYFCYTNISHVLKEQGAASLRNTIIESSKQCCAIEGAYPESLEYLEKKYGLSINKKDYIVTYEVYAENIAPTVVVLVR